MRVNHYERAKRLRMSPFALKHTRKIFKMATTMLYSVLDNPKTWDLPASTGSFVVRQPTRYAELFRKSLILNTISKSTG